MDSISKEQAYLLVDRDEDYTIITIQGDSMLCRRNSLEIEYSVALARMKCEFVIIGVIEKEEEGEKELADTPLASTSSVRVKRRIIDLDNEQ